MIGPAYLIAGNWKMYKTTAEATKTAEELVQGCSDVRADVEILIAPAFTALQAVAAAIEGSRVMLGAQNLHWESEGAFTGEISAGMLTTAGCSHVIIGHSERRQYFGETDETVNRKIMAAVGAGLKPIFCIGETAQQRETGETAKVLTDQLQKGLAAIPNKELNGLIVAYEPVWAIGTGLAATAEIAQDAHGLIRAEIEKICGSTLAKSLKILYGGSVKPNNVKVLMNQPDINGALVGGASLDAGTFSRLVHFYQ
jgi:triosephosphate isomerase